MDNAVAASLWRSRSHILNAAFGSALVVIAADVGRADWGGVSENVRGLLSGCSVVVILAAILTR